MKDLPTSADVTDALNAADYPAEKERLLQVAALAGADDAVLDALRALPLADYRSKDEVLRSVATADPF